MGGRFCLGHQQRLLRSRSYVVSSLGLVPVGWLRPLWRRVVRRGLRRRWRVRDGLYGRRLHDLRSGRNACWPRNDWPSSTACSRPRAFCDRRATNGRRRRSSDGRRRLPVLYESRPARFPSGKPTEHRPVVVHVGQTFLSAKTSRQECLLNGAAHCARGRASRTVRYQAEPGNEGVSRPYSARRSARCSARRNRNCWKARSRSALRGRRWVRNRDHTPDRACRS